MRPAQKHPSIRFVKILASIPEAAQAQGKQRPGHRAKLVLVGETADGRIRTETRTVSRPMPTREQALTVARTRAAAMERRAGVDA